MPTDAHDSNGERLPIVAEIADAPASAGHGAGFFAVGRDTFVRARDLGMNPAAALLVLARGSAADNATTSWSAEAAAGRLGVRWTSAKTAIADLERHNLIRTEKGSTRPRYTIQRKGADLWLPNTLVDGAASEAAPVLRLRQTQDVMTLRLFVELYGEQNLREDGGISPGIIRQTFERERVGDFAQFTVWQFSGGLSTTWPHLDIIRPHMSKKKNRWVGETFWGRWQTLESMGLVEWVPYLFEGSDGEPIHPLSWSNSIPEEKALYDACVSAGYRCLTDWQQERVAEKGGGVVVPVPKHIGQATLIGIARLHYRPRTRLTGAWWVDQVAGCRDCTSHDEAIAAATAELDDAASSAEMPWWHEAASS